MERFIGVDDARGSLGRLVEEVATSGDVVSLTKRGEGAGRAGESRGADLMSILQRSTTSRGPVLARCASHGTGPA